MHVERALWHQCGDGWKGKTLGGERSEGAPLRQEVAIQAATHWEAQSVGTLRRRRGQRADSGTTVQFPALLATWMVVPFTEVYAQEKKPVLHEG